MRSTIESLRADASKAVEAAMQPLKWMNGLVDIRCNECFSIVLNSSFRYIQGPYQMIRGRSL
jgi:hypothetical protein